MVSVFLIIEVRSYREALERALTASDQEVVGVAEHPLEAIWEIEVIQPGLALFLGTDIFQEGTSDWQRISSAAREVARNSNGRARRQSVTVSITSSGIMLFCAHR